MNKLESFDENFATTSLESSESACLLLAYVDRSGSDCKPAVSAISTLFKTTYTSKMAEKRQRGLAEMWHPILRLKMLENASPRV